MATETVTPATARTVEKCLEHLDEAVALLCVAELAQEFAAVDDAYRLQKLCEVANRAVWAARCALAPLEDAA